MIQVIPASKRRSTSQQFGEAFSNAAQQISNYQLQKEQSAAEEAQKRRSLEFEYGLKGGLEERKQAAKYAEKLKAMEKSGLVPQNMGSQLQGSQSRQGKEFESPQNIETSSFLDNKPPHTQEEINAASLFEPQLANAYERQNEEWYRQKRHEEDIILRKEETARKEIIDFHKESEKYEEELRNKTRVAKNQINTIGIIEKALESGNVKPGSIANIFRGFGEIGNKIANAFLTGDEATLLASIPSLLEGWKEVFGVRLSDADLRVLQDKLPDIGKTPEANKAITNIIKKYAEMTLLRSEISKDIKKKNKNLRPSGYADMIEQRFDEMVQPMKVINPNTGNIIEIPAYKVSDAIKAGAKIVNE